MEENKKTEELTTEEKQETTEVKGKKRTIAIIIAAVILVLGGLYINHASKFESTDDAYVESHLVQIAPKVSGEVVEIFIDDNQKIKEGDTVIKIDDTDYKVRLAQAEANYKKALLSQKVARANLSAINSETALAKKDLERYQNLYKAGAVSKQELDRAQTKYDGIVAKNLQATENIMSNNYNKVVDADIKALKAIMDQAKLNLEYTTVKTLRSGTVTKKNVEKGAFVQMGQPLFAVASDEVWVVANFKENQVGKMKVGQSVEIKVDAYPNRTFKGRIDSIQRASGAKSSLFPPENAVGSFVKIVQRIPVKIVFEEKIDPDELNIVAGMSVIPKVRVK
ncbi:HlyD family secretion protein [bacterium]|nr:HlyD family secretion protein [bacterium]